jgi:hypothetical protein
MLRATAVSATLKFCRTSVEVDISGDFQIVPVTLHDTHADSFHCEAQAPAATRVRGYSCGSAFSYNQ